MKNPQQLLTLIGCLLSLVAISQTQSPTNPALDRIAERPYHENWVRIKPEADIPPRDLFTQHKSAFRLEEKDEMRLVKTEKDALGFTHYRYQLYYESIKVEGAEYIVHARNGRTEKANGHLPEMRIANTRATRSAGNALTIALAHVNAKKYRWKDPREEALLKRLKKDPNATYYPTPELVITTVDSKQAFNKRPLALAYRIDIYAQIPDVGYAVYVNARSGQVVKKISLTMNCGAEAGTANTLFNDSQPINTQEIYVDNQKKYRLFDNSRGDGINTRKPDEEIDHDENNWGNNWSAATSAHWAAMKVYDYYIEEHGRNSFDKNGAEMLNYIDTNFEGNEASWNGTYTRYRNTNNGYWVSLDIVGHEWTHAVTDYAANLVYQNEPGALNESFSDIFGAMVQFSVEEDLDDYLIGEDFINGGIRNMQDPGSNKGFDFNLQLVPVPGPDTYKGNHWHDYKSDDSDNGGVHTNSSVQNHWFYLLAQGGIGSNNYVVNAIGRDDAAAIAYRNLTVYLTSHSDYDDAREGAIEAAIDIYQECSWQVIETTNAWHAVGVGEPAINGENWPENITLDQPIIAPEEYKAQNSLTASATIAENIDVSFTAGERVLLQPGFAVNPSGESRFTVNTVCLVVNAGPPQNINERMASIQEPAGEETTKPDKPLAYPNPFREQVTFRYRMEEEDVPITLTIYDATGTRVAVSENGKVQPNGYYETVWHATGLPEGLYFYRLQSGTEMTGGTIIRQQ